MSKARLEFCLGFTDEPVRFGPSIYPLSLVVSWGYTCNLFLAKENWLLFLTELEVGRIMEKTPLLTP